jgi:hypothetical protein
MKPYNPRLRRMQKQNPMGADRKTAAWTGQEKKGSDELRDPKSVNQRRFLRM